MRLALLAAVLLVYLPAPASAGAGPFSIIRQSTPASCGAATIATLAGWAGLPLSEQTLLDLLETKIAAGDPARLQKIRSEGASVSEMIQLAAGSGVGLALQPMKVTELELRRLLKTEPVIIYAFDQAARGNPQAHFTIIAGVDLQRGFLRADTVEGRFFWQTAPALIQSARLWDGNSRFLILRMARTIASLPIAPPLPEPAFAGRFPDIARARLLSGSLGTQFPTVSVRLTRQQLRAPIGDDVALSSVQDSAAITWLQPVGRRTTVSLTLPLSRASDRLGSAGRETLNLGSTFSTNGIVAGVSHRIGQPDTERSLALDASVQLGLPDIIEHVSAGLTSSAGLSSRLIVSGRLGMQVGIGSRPVWLAFSPSLAVSHLVGRKAVASLELQADVPISSGAGPAAASATFTMERQVSRRVSVGLLTSRQVAGAGRNWSIGIVGSWQFGQPRRGRDLR